MLTWLIITCPITNKTLILTHNIPYNVLSVFEAEIFVEHANKNFEGYIFVLTHMHNNFVV